MSEEEMLVPRDKYLECGVHIGTRVKSKFMEPFIYRIRNDGLCVLDVKKTDQRIRIAAKFLARFEPDKILAVSVRRYGARPVEMFAKVTKAHAITLRFWAGTLSNPVCKTYVEPDVLIVTDPRADRQAVKEAAIVGIPVVAFCDTDLYPTNVDLIIPANNKGRKSLALLYWLLARQLLRERGEIPPDGDIEYTPEDFMTRL
ncbi:30S ribosomal protein S2 [archaeon]|nr:MAG: 30S ribosomal protein S2 [archaeon]RLG66114.1 MAG: 30S ribosomal protein S2 [archaeon]HDM23806.1 30S ribosomal protein S2 [Candidatus Bathyarchaeota archaeon]